MGVRHKWIGVGFVLALVAGTAAAADANPEGGIITDGIYSNSYFGLNFPLPDGYGPGLDPAPPSITGYYVLNAPKHTGSHAPVMVIAAQDLFFSPPPIHNALELTESLQHAKAPTATFQPTAGPAASVTADEPASQVTFNGHSFAEVKTRSTILSHLTLATDIRCHIVSINLTSNDPAELDAVAASFAKITVPSEASPITDGTSASGTTEPVCVKDYATNETILHQVKPRIDSAKFLKIPVRIIIGKDGKVKHVHVVKAPDDDNKTAIEEALMKWEFKPYQVNGQPVEVETGLSFEN
jgi:hypothetical protein